MNVYKFIQLFLLSSFGFYTAQLLSCEISSSDHLHSRMEISLGELQAQIDDVILTLFKIGGTPKQVLIIFYTLRRDINTFISTVLERLQDSDNIADLRQDFANFTKKLSTFNRDVVNTAGFHAQDRRILRWTIADLQKTIKKIEWDLCN